MHVAVIGAGITGTSVALLLARRGVRVTLFEAAAGPLTAASRWNEGKIHLGHLYAADHSLETARRLLPGGLAFRPLIEELTGSSLEPVTTPDDDTYAVHRDSVVDSATTARYFELVTALAADHPDARRYLVDVRGARAVVLTKREREARFDSATVVAAFRVPERSVSTQWVADRLLDAIAATSVDIVANCSVRTVHQPRESPHEPLDVVSNDGRVGPFDWVVNASWEGRLRIDQSVGLAPPPAHSHRFRLALFVRTRSPVPVGSSVVSTGPFGDIKNYNGRDLYVSWYPAGLIAEGHAVDPPPVPELATAERTSVATTTFRELGKIVSGLDTVESAAAHVRVEGGWVFAAGRGPLSDPTSTLHRRQHVGVTRRGRYVSIDTGKYSIAPWLAAQVVNDIAG
jgi:hypothetical protein